MARRMEQTPWRKRIFIDSSFHGIGLQHRTDTLLMKSFIKQFQIVLGAGVVLFTAWGLVFAYAFLRRDRLLRLMAFWVVITPLPLALVTIRGDACLYIPLFGWAM